MTSLARRERLALADLAEQLGPDAPTLCGDWSTRDLLAHLVVREGSPLGSPGIKVPFMAGLTDREMSRVGDWAYADIVDRVRRPPLWSPSAIGPVDSLGNLVEMFVHHEDIRRAGADWAPRELSPADQDTLWRPLRALGRLMVRKAGVPVTLRRTDSGAGSKADSKNLAVLRRGDGAVVAGAPSELVLFCYSREQADVELTGDEQAIAALKAAEKGL